MIEVWNFRGNSLRIVGNLFAVNMHNDSLPSLMLDVTFIYNNGQKEHVHVVHLLECVELHAN